MYNYNQRRWNDYRGHELHNRNESSFYQATPQTMNISNNVDLWCDMGRNNGGLKTTSLNREDVQ